MKEPRIRFSIDVEKDIDNAKNFLYVEPKFLKDFLPLDLQYILDESFSLAKRGEIIEKYTKEIYDAKREEIENGVKSVEGDWLRIEKDFYRLVNQIFNKHPWPKGKYIGYTSIYGMYPRYLDEKVFFFPYSKNNVSPIGVVGHEMIHFLFFDYIEKKYTKEKLDEIKDSQYVWRVSEAFNTVIENWEPYKKVMGIKYVIKPYPDCEKMYTEMEQQWSKEPKIEKFLNAWLDV